MSDPWSTASEELLDGSFLLLLQLLGPVSFLRAVCVVFAALLPRAECGSFASATLFSTKVCLVIACSKFRSALVIPSVGSEFRLIESGEEYGARTESRLRQWPRRAEYHLLIARAFKHNSELDPHPLGY
jgi:hypothetical protein